MNYNKLYPVMIILVLTALLIGIAVVMFDKTKVGFADNVVGNESVTLVLDTAVDFSQNYVTSVTFVGNGSDTCSNYTTSTLSEETVSITAGSNTTVQDGCVGDMDVEYKYYDVSQKAPETMGYSTTEIGKIASDWLGLIVTVIVCAIILFLILQGFNPKKRR